MNKHHIGFDKPNKAFGKEIAKGLDNETLTAHLTCEVKNQAGEVVEVVTFDPVHTFNLMISEPDTRDGEEGIRIAGTLQADYETYVTMVVAMMGQLPVEDLPSVLEAYSQQVSTHKMGVHVVDMNDPGQRAFVANELSEGAGCVRIQGKKIPQN